MQVSARGWSEYFPGGQAAHVGFPAPSAAVPFWQLKQCDCPARFCAVPGGQRSQEGEAERVEILPGSQTRQVVAVSMGE